MTAGTPRAPPMPDVQRPRGRGAHTAHLLGSHRRACDGPVPDHLYRSNKCISPDLHPFLGRQVQARSRLHVVGGIPIVEVAHHAIDPKLSRRVLVSDNLVLQELGRRLAPPCLRPAEKKALFTGQSIKRRRSLSRQRPVIHVRVMQFSYRGCMTGSQKR